jgi:hypothetical protein
VRIGVYVDGFNLYYGMRIYHPAPRGPGFPFLRRLLPDPGQGGRRKPASSVLSLAELEWRGAVTVNALHLLRCNGRA